VRSADSGEFADWVGPHVGAMARLAARLAPDADHDDVVQESLVRAWRRRSTYDDAGERECPVVVFSLGVNYERHRLRCLHVPNDQLRRGEAIRFEFELVAAGNGDGGKVPGSSALEWRFDAVPFGGPGGASVPVTVTD